MIQGTGGMPALDAEQGHEHPGNRKYIWIAIILAIVTAVEVAIYYVPAFESFLVEALIVLSFAKFIVVVGYFMHLKFDPRLLAFIFGSGMIAALAVYIAVGVMMDHRSVDVFFGGQ